jgi:hypothetical protein
MMDSSYHCMGNSLWAGPWAKCHEWLIEPIAPMIKSVTECPNARLAALPLSFVATLPKSKLKHFSRLQGCVWFKG